MSGDLPKIESKIDINQLNVDKIRTPSHIENLFVEESAPKQSSQTDSNQRAEILRLFLAGESTDPPDILDYISSVRQSQIRTPKSTEQK